MQVALCLRVVFDSSTLTVEFEFDTSGVVDAPDLGRLRFGVPSPVSLHSVDEGSDVVHLNVFDLFGLFAGYIIVVLVFVVLKERQVDLWL